MFNQSFPLRMWRFWTSLPEAFFPILEEFHHDVDVHTKSEEYEASVRTIAANSGEGIGDKCKKKFEWIIHYSYGITDIIKYVSLY